MSVMDKNWKNEDNPYGYFVMHYYHSILDANGKHVDIADEVIPIIPCKYKPGEEKSIWVGKHTYCPDYDYEKIKIGKSYSTKY